MIAAAVSNATVFPGSLRAVAIHEKIAVLSLRHDDRAVESVRLPSKISMLECEVRLGSRVSSFCFERTKIRSVRFGVGLLIKARITALPVEPVPPRLSEMENQRVMLHLRSSLRGRFKEG